MTLKEINQAYNRIISSLDNKEVKSAFDSLQSVISGNREYTFQDTLDQIQETYKYMLRYQMDGIKDPMQEDIYQNILTSAYELADQLRHSLLTPSSPLSFYSQRRQLQSSPEISLDQVHKQLVICYETGNTIKYEELQCLLFSKIWVSDPFTSNDNVAIKEIWNTPILPFSVQCQVASALTLGLQASFDKEKLLLLFDAAQISTSEEVRMRVFIGILLSLYKYRKRTPLYPKIAERLATLAEEPGFTQTIKSITLRFILARETEKISRKLRDEILPEMMKLNKKTNLSDFGPDLSDEKNPEWQNMFSDTSLGKKLEEFSELQQEGADLMHSTFIHLKNFSFFREISNWFLPFSSTHSMLGNRPETGNYKMNIPEAMMSFSFMCNSDKYSLCFSTMQLSEGTRRIMLGQLLSQISGMMEQNKEDAISKRGKAEIIAAQYIQDLYRFFKLHPAHPDFEDIFMWPLDFHNLPILQPYISDPESLITIAEYYLRKNYADDALTIYTHLAKTQKENDMLFQKIGYCLQMGGDIDGALEAYLHADLLNTGSKWLIRRIAGCYRSLKNPREAFKYYHRYEELSPDNLSVQINIGNCLLELKDYNEALKYYFKVDYLDTKSHKAWRPIAWCSFLTGRYDQARNYYKKIIQEDIPDMYDFLNAGHTEWALQNNRKAVEFYLLAIRKEEGNFYKFREQFIQDIPDLIVAGIRETEVPLMLDQLRYLN
jgi:tetratricopeptide (TPR) repeat protein